MTRRDGLLDFRWDYIFACFALVFFSFVFAREILAFHTSFVHPDFRLFYAFRQWFSYRLLSGEFPLWNPYWGIGGPAEAWATIPIDLYTVLERFFGPQYHVFQWFQLLLLLGTGFYAFLKLGFKPMIAVFGCILFFMTPWVTYFYFYFMKPHSFIFLPLIFVFIHEWTRTGRRGYFFLTCWAVILSMFGTKPEFWFYQTAYFLFFCILGGLTYREGAWPNAIRRMGGGMLAIGIGLMAQAWQIHLLTQIMKSADRSLEHGLGNLVRWEMWQHLGQSFFEWDLTRLSALGVPFFLGVMVHRQRFKNALGLIGVIVFLWLKGWTDPLLLSFLRSPVLIGTVAGMVLIVLSHLRRKWIWGQFIKTGFVYLLFIYYWCRPERGDLGEMEVIRSAPFVFKTLLSALVWVGCWEFWNNKLVRLAYFSILFVLVMRLQGQILLAYLSGLLWIPTRDNYLIDF